MMGVMAANRSEQGPVADHHGNEEAAYYRVAEWLDPSTLDEGVLEEMSERDEWGEDSPSPHAALLDELYGWVSWEHVAANERLAVSGAELREWRAGLAATLGGSMPASMETDVRAFFGEVAAEVDNVGAGDRDPFGELSTACRDALDEVGLAPGGGWRVQLLLDRASVLASILHRLPGLDVEGEREWAIARLGVLRDEAVGLQGSTSPRIQRGATAVVAVCDVVLGDAEPALSSTYRFFDLEEQAERESGARPSLQELSCVLDAGLRAATILEDRVAAAEVVRRVRLVAEEDRSLPIALRLRWASGVAGLDPAQAQMVAEDGLNELNDAGHGSGDEAFHAALIVFEALVTLGDDDAVDLLANEWVPRALAVPYSTGAQGWLARTEVTYDVDPEA